MLSSEVVRINNKQYTALINIHSKRKGLYIALKLNDMTFKQSRPLIELIKPKKFTDIVILFCHQYGYTHGYVANKITMPLTTFSGKLKTGKFSANEAISITNFIRSKT